MSGIRDIVRNFGYPLIQRVDISEIARLEKVLDFIPDLNWLKDVSLQNPQDGEVLQLQSGQWVNAPAGAGPMRYTFRARNIGVNEVTFVHSIRAIDMPPETQAMLEMFGSPDTVILYGNWNSLRLTFDAFETELNLTIQAGISEDNYIVDGRAYLIGNKMIVVKHVADSSPIIIRFEISEGGGSWQEISSPSEEWLSDLIDALLAESASEWNSGKDLAIRNGVLYRCDGSSTVQFTSDNETWSQIEFPYAVSRILIDGNILYGYQGHWLQSYDFQSEEFNAFNLPAGSPNQGIAKSESFILIGGSLKLPRNAALSRVSQTSLEIFMAISISDVRAICSRGESFFVANSGDVVYELYRIPFFDSI